MLSKLLESFCEDSTSLKSFDKLHQSSAQLSSTRLQHAEHPCMNSNRVGEISLWFSLVEFVQYKIVFWHIFKFLAHIMQLLNRLYLIGTLRNYDGNGKVNVKKAIGLMSKPTTLHVHNSFLHFFAIPAQLWPKMTKFSVYLRTVTAGDKFRHLCLNSGASPSLQL